MNTGRGTAAFNALFNLAQQHMKKAAKITNPSFLGVIILINPGKRYNVQTPDGKVYRKVGSSLPTDSFEVGTWVTLEWTGSDWSIIGYAGRAAGTV